ncbi:MAG: Holliday junction branch migration DNA helicase RuvB, partial [Rhodospirillaceae bacterium]|nr:Holliday junction branch migration DNA helicase RuvB [Rhodospirillaceae bacterium]
MVEERLINSSLTDEDLNDSNTRPNRLGEFVGQRVVCDNLKVFVDAARERNEAMD